MDKDTLDIIKDFSFELLKNNIENHYKTGSQVVRSVTPNDYDFIVYETPEDKPLEAWLKSQKFVEDRGENYAGGHLEGSDFCSYRKHKLNVIYTNDKRFYEKYVSATLMVEKKQPEEKADRVAVFEAVMNGTDSERFRNIMSRKNEDLMFEPAYGIFGGSGLTSGTTTGAGTYTFSSPFSPFSATSGAKEPGSFKKHLVETKGGLRPEELEELHSIITKSRDYSGDLF